MLINLPEVISAYFIADTGDSAAVGRCFAMDATVKDEGKTYVGITEIERWKTESTSKYTYTSSPFAINHVDGKTIVTSHVVGNFPGSPVDLQYAFEIKDNKITSLEVIP